MRCKNTYQNRPILFKRWSRTPWAVFASLNIVVHNHCTRISSFKDSLLKQQGADRAESVSLSTETDRMSEFEDVGVPWEEFLLIEFLLLNILHTKIEEEVQSVLLHYTHIIIIIIISLSTILWCR